MQLLAIPLLFLALLPPESTAQSTVKVVHGHCTGCDRPYRLGRFQFVDALHGWAEGFFIADEGEHVSQYSTVLRTHDGGRHWTPVKSVMTYGVDAQPTFWFTGARGCIAGSFGDDEIDRFICTNDGGLHWHDLPVTLSGTFVHLQFFDSRRAIGAASTSDGARFVATVDGGLTWKDTPMELAYPDSLVFLTPKVGWMAGVRSDDDNPLTRVFSTVDGGKTWRPATMPSMAGDPHDLFFADSERGWLVLWLRNRGGSALLQSEDGGRSWKETPIADPGGGRLFFDAVRFLSRDVGYVLADSGGIASALATRDGGRTWQKIPLPSAVQFCEIVKDEVWCGSGMDLIQLRPGR